MPRYVIAEFECTVSLDTPNIPHLRGYIVLHSWEQCMNTPISASPLQQSPVKLLNFFFSNREE